MQAKPTTIEEDIELAEKNALKLGITDEHQKKRLRRMIVAWRRIAAEVANAPAQDQNGREEMISRHKWSTRPDLAAIIKRYLRVSVWTELKQARVFAVQVREAYRAYYGRSLAPELHYSGAADDPMTEEERIDYLSRRQFGRNKEIAAAVMSAIEADKTINTRAKMQAAYERIYQQKARATAAQKPFDLMVYLSTKELSRVPYVREKIARELIASQPESAKDAKKISSSVRRMEMGVQRDIGERRKYINEADFTDDVIRNAEVKQILVERIVELTTIGKIDYAAKRLVTGKDRKTAARKEICRVAVYANELSVLTERAAENGVTLGDVISGMIPARQELLGELVEKFPFELVEDIHYQDSVRYVEVPLTRQQQSVLGKVKAAVQAQPAVAGCQKPIVESKIISAISRGR